MKRLNSEDRTVVTVTVIIAIAVLAAVIFTIVRILSEKDEKHTGADPDAEPGIITEAEPLDLCAGMMNISMNTTPVLENGRCNLMISNSGNVSSQRVELMLDGEIIYRSGMIPAGSGIETAKMDIDLPTGTYRCTAMFYSADPQSGKDSGCAGIEIQLTVKN